MNRKPFAVELYERYLNGETIQELSSKLKIPAERIEIRIRAASAYVSRSRQTSS